MSRYYRRHLPHGAPDDAAVFITFNLKGSLPKEALVRIEQIRKDFDSRHVDDTNLAQVEMARQIFRISEEYLDAACNGPLYLQEPRHAEIVAQNILDGVGNYYELFAFAVMANHVHLLLKPNLDLERITGGYQENYFPKN